MPPGHQTVKGVVTSRGGIACRRVVISKVDRSAPVSAANCSECRFSATSALLSHQRRVIPAHFRGNSSSLVRECDQCRHMHHEWPMVHQARGCRRAGRGAGSLSASAAIGRQLSTIRRNMGCLPLSISIMSIFGEPGLGGEYRSSPSEDYGLLGHAWWCQKAWCVAAARRSADT